MAVLDFSGDLLAFRCQRHIAVWFIVDQFLCGQFFEHACDRSPFDIQFTGDVFGSGYSVTDLQPQDGFQVIFDVFGKGNGFFHVCLLYGVLFFLYTKDIVSQLKMN